MENSGFVIENGTLVKYTGTGGNIVVPDGVKMIGNSAFHCNRSLTRVEIPDSVNKIGHWAFECCTNLEVVTMPKSLESIGWNVFHECHNLTLLVFAGSYAEQHAKDNGIRYELI